MKIRRLLGVAFVMAVALAGCGDPVSPWDDGEEDDHEEPTPGGPGDGEALNVQIQTGPVLI